MNTVCLCLCGGGGGISDRRMRLEFHMCFLVNPEGTRVLYVTHTTPPPLCLPITKFSGGNLVSRADEINIWSFSEVEANNCLGKQSNLYDNHFIN